MIKEVQGDILLSQAELVAHGVAPMDHFENGLSLSLRTKYPAMVKDFRHHCHLHNPKPGELFYWRAPDGNQIVSLLTQESSGMNHTHGLPGKASLSQVDHALKNLAKLIQKEGIKSLSLPRLATGVGGLQWSDVHELIKKNLANLDTNIYVYSNYIKDQKAAEV